MNPQEQVLQTPDIHRQAVNVKPKSRWQILFLAKHHRRISRKRIDSTILPAIERSCADVAQCLRELLSIDIQTNIETGNEQVTQFVEALCKV